ncbi:MAG: hypothetical protein J0L70_00075 [Leptolyngbya sp. UWPOB_LEPTO1]|uniref:hypothetical protein n=1 Tax=Leptolyngbya sp. UWPOB_LEPTO1 TaxID=2815653 RepID=UPI001AC67BC5|nr:hypothetical protein [Leptolyngbya sp. UWPOB_LEPTO1]MBN8558900.1 hypothetical protein [Leptolyngbya sp. UWPOB_LEPTO1]
MCDQRVCIGFARIVGKKCQMYFAYLQNLQSIPVPRSEGIVLRFDPLLLLTLVCTASIIILIGIAFIPKWFYDFLL